MLLGLLLAVSLFAFSKKVGEKLSCKHFWYRLWKMRGVYTPLVIHIYDTATDIGVLYEWYKLAKREKNGTNIESLNMEQLFWIAMGFMIAYRGILGLGGFVAGGVLLGDTAFPESLDGIWQHLGYGIVFIAGGICGFIGAALELGLFVVIFFEQKEVMENHSEKIAKMIANAKKRKQAKTETEGVETEAALKEIPAQCVKFCTFDLLQ